MQAEPVKRGRGRPRKNPLPVEPHQEPEQPAIPAIVVDSVTAIGICPCLNTRWIYADLNGTRIQVKILKFYNSPKNKKIRCRQIEGKQYEEIR